MENTKQPTHSRCSIKGSYFYLAIQGSIASDLEITEK